MQLLCKQHKSKWNIKALVYTKATFALAPCGQLLPTLPLKLLHLLFSYEENHKNEMKSKWMLTCKGPLLPLLPLLFCTQALRA
jgi:hypothetical protein